MDGRAELLKRALDVSREPMALVDSSGELVFVSSSLGALLGVSPAEAEGKMCQSLFGESMCSEALCLMREGDRRCPSVSFSNHNGLVECRRILSPQGDLLGAVISLSRRDVEFREALRDLSFQRRLIGAITEDSGALFAALDLSGRVLYCNDTLGALLPQRAKDRFIWELAPEESQNIKSALQWAIKSPPDFQGEHFHVRAFLGEEPRHLLLRVLPISGGPMGEAAVVMGSDITDLVVAQEGRDVFRNALDQFSQSVCITDPSGTITYVNTSFQEMYGYTLREAVGKNPSILNPGRQVYQENGVLPEEYDRIFRGLWESILDPGLGRWEGQVINRRKDGSLLWVRLIVSAIRDRYGRLMAFLGIPVDMTSQRAQEEKLLLEAYRAITLTAELRDEETGEHLIRISDYCRLLSEVLGMPPKFCRDMEIFAPFHDIGKVGIPDGILLAPRRLDPGEFDLIKTHTVMGYNILKDKPSLAMAAEIALYHHERWDGSGYPYGIKGTEIPMSARITALADVYDALRSRRPYKASMEHQKVVEYVASNRGTLFDPVVVDAFEEVHLEFNQIFVTKQ